MFLSSFHKFKLKIIWSAFSPKLFFLIFNILHLHKNFVMHTIFHILTNVIQVVKNLIFQKSLTSHETNWTLLFLSFYSHEQKPKRNHQIASSRAKTRSRRSQACVKYRGIIICIKRNTDVNTSDLKILHKKMSK